MKSIAIAVSLCLLSIASFAQTAPAPPPNPSTTSSTFTLSASVLSLSGNSVTSAATDIGGTFAVTPNLLLRSDNILAPAANYSGYFGGLQYGLPTAKILAKTNLDPAHFQFYVTGSAGTGHVTVGTAPTQAHFNMLAGGGVNYDPTGSGKFAVNLIEARYARMPGVSNSTWVVSSGLHLGFSF